MKKVLITSLAGVLIISAVSFARPGQTRGNQGYQGNAPQQMGQNIGAMQGQGGFMRPELSAEQQEKVLEIHQKYDVELETLRIGMQEISLKIRQEQLKDTTDWNAVENLLKEKSEKQTEMQLLRMKIGEEIEEETGLSRPFSSGNRMNGVSKKGRR